MILLLILFSDDDLYNGFTAHGEFDDMDDLGEDFEEENLNEPADMTQITAEKAKKVDGSQCSICREKLKIGDMVVRLRCKHHFHKACVQPWFKDNNTCPNCRSEATDLPENENDWEDVEENDI